MFLAAALGVALSAHGREIMAAKVEGVVGPPMARFMNQALASGAADDCECVIFELDTPGGLDESMRQITKGIMSSKVPVIVYVAPAGSRAASAGVFITMAAHVAAMAPGTAIGAAHPVELPGGGPMDTNMAAKVENDAAAYIRSLAEKHGRNAAWAEEAVRRSVSLTEQEALHQKVIDLVAPDTDDLIRQLEGRTVEVSGVSRTLHTNGASIMRFEMNWRDRFLTTLANPNIAYVLFLVGLLGLYFEFATPGAILPGVAGAICLILAFFAFQSLPVNYAGMMLIVLAGILFIVDVKAATHGVLTIGGLIALFLGSVMLFDTGQPALRVSLRVIVPAVLVVGAFFAIGAWLSALALRRAPISGAQGLVGETGDARTVISPAGGSAFVAGTHWNATADSVIAAGVRVRVVRVSGMTLHVESLAATAQPQPGV